MRFTAFPLVFVVLQCALNLQQHAAGARYVMKSGLIGKVVAEGDVAAENASALVAAKPLQKLSSAVTRFLPKGGAANDTLGKIPVEPEYHLIQASADPKYKLIHVTSSPHLSSNSRVFCTSVVSSRERALPPTHDSSRRKFGFLVDISDVIILLGHSSENVLYTGRWYWDREGDKYSQQGSFADLARQWNYEVADVGDFQKRDTWLAAFKYATLVINMHGAGELRRIYFTENLIKFLFDHKDLHSERFVPTGPTKTPVSKWFAMALEILGSLKYLLANKVSPLELLNNCFSTRTVSEVVVVLRASVPTVTRIS